MSFIKKIKAIFNSVNNWFTNLLINNDKLVKVYAPVGVNFCNFVKEYNDADATKTAEELIEDFGGKYGKIAVTIIQKLFTDDNMDKIINGLEIAEKAASATTVAEKIILVMNYINSLNISAKADALTSLAAIVTQNLSGTTVTLSNIKTIVQAIYETKSNL